MTCHECQSDPEEESTDQEEEGTDQGDPDELEDDTDVCVRHSSPSGRTPSSPEPLFLSNGYFPAAPLDFLENLLRTWRF